MNLMANDDRRRDTRQITAEIDLSINSQTGRNIDANVIRSHGNQPPPSLKDSKKDKG
jgi:hypothetical protein